MRVYIPPVLRSRLGGPSPLDNYHLTNFFQKLQFKKLYSMYKL
jgi:hypothetical protein